MLSRIRKVRVVAVAVPVAFLVVAGTALADPVLMESMGLDVWEIGRLERELQSHDRRGDELAKELQDTLDLTATNDLIEEDVIAGRLDLPTAAARKWDLNQHRLPYRGHLDLWRKGASYEEKMAHDLYCRIANRDPATAQSIRDRLNREFEAAYGTALPAK